MDILAALPKTPGMAPEALWAWLKRNGKVHPQELIRYKTTRLADPLTGIREKYAACNCTACGESWHTTMARRIAAAKAFSLSDTPKAPKNPISPCSWTRQQAKFCRTVAGTTAQEPRKWKRLNRHGFAKSSSHGWTTNRRP